MAISFDYTVLRIVPLVERHEFLNTGVVLLCRERGYLGARAVLDEGRLLSLAPGAPVERLRGLLEVVLQVAGGDPSAGPIAALDAPARFHWLAAPSSTVLQPSPVHCGLCSDPAEALDRLFDRLVRV